MRVSYLALAAATSFVACIAAAAPPRHRAGWGSALRQRSAVPTVSAPARASTGTVTVDITPSSAVNTIDPSTATGFALDSQPAGSLPSLYTQRNVGFMLSMGLGTFSYRLYTELGVQAWHWSSAGTWSDASGAGYFTGSIVPTPITDSHAYRLPHRGFTHDQANDDDYSRLDDGDLSTYWKSNPYLSEAYTGEPDSEHPQWVVVDLGRVLPVDAIRIAWAAPYAVDYRIQYWTGADAMGDPAAGQWVQFEHGHVTDGVGGTLTRRLASTPVSAQFIRLLMTQSSGTYDSHGSADRRNAMGYAIAELGAGAYDASGKFRDAVRHEPDNKQTVTYVSSVDPWHAPTDVVTDQEQPGLDLVFGARLNAGHPALVPVSMAYGTPQDAAAEVAFLESRGYPLLGVELGEEPDGQYMLPEDYGALFVQWADAIHAVDPSLRVGGPVLQEMTEVPVWPNVHGDASWIERFRAYLGSRDRLQDLGFASFEHYPFNSDLLSQAELMQEPGLVAGFRATLRADGVGANVPFYVSEANCNSDNCQAEMDICGGQWQADFVGSLLTNGGAGVFYYEGEPEPLQLSQNGKTWGALSPFVASPHYHVRYFGAQYNVATLLATQWLQSGGGRHQIFPTVSSLTDSTGGVVVTGYAALRPDARWAVLLVNKDPKHGYHVHLRFKNKGDHYLSGAVIVATFGPLQYTWYPDGPNGYASPDGPVLVDRVTGTPDTEYEVPKGSVVAVRGLIK